MGRNSYYDYTYLGNRGSHGQSAVEFYDDHTNVLFYSKITKNAIGCWLTNATYAQNTQGSINLPGYPADIKIQENTNGTMWVLTSPFPAFFDNKPLSSDRFNYQVSFGKTDTIIKGSHKLHL